MKILILKPSSLGDVVQALPVLRLLKLHWPHGEIFWWIDSKLAPLIGNDPDLAGIVRFERSRWASPRYWPELFASIRRMRQERFDLVIDLQCLSRSASFGWLANGKCFAGLDEIREGARAFYDLIVPPPPYLTHAVDRYLGVLEALGVPVHWNFDWLPARDSIAAEIKQKWNTGAAEWIVIQPGARWVNKRWPVENFGQLVRQAALRHPRARFAILGGDADRDLGATIAGADPQRCVDLTGRLSLPEMIEWIRLSALMISNDTGPMHVAAALRKPVIAIFGPTEPRRTGPYGQFANVIQTSLYCVPCMKSRCVNPNPLECLHAVSVAQVLGKMETVLPGASR